MNEWNYLSETELLNIIEDAEQNPILKAPDYLKSQILQEASRQTKPKCKTSLLLFGAKITAAAAASIALLFSMPKLTQSEELLQKATEVSEHSLVNHINQKTNHFCSILSDTTNSILMKETIQ